MLCQMKKKTILKKYGAIKLIILVYLIDYCLHFEMLNKDKNLNNK